MTKLLDLLLCAVMLALGACVAAPLGLVLRLTRRRGPRRIVYLGTGQIAQVFPRNGANLFLSRECSDFDGYFEQMWNVHFPAGARGRLDLTPRHHLIDTDTPVPRQLGRRASMALREMAFLLWLLPFAWRVRASILTATNPFLQGLNAAIAARLLGLPYGVIITRDYDWDWSVLHKAAFGSVFGAHRLEKAIGRWVLRHADVVLADRQYYRDYAVRSGAEPSRTIATRVLADDAYAVARCDPSIRSRYGLSAGPLLVYVGRLDADKLVLDLVECAALVRERFPDAQLVCAGTGSLVETLRERAHALDVQLHLLGAVDLSELPTLVASSDAVVAPHMGYTLIEAGLTGVPIVTYDYDFHAEIIQNGVTGFLAPLGNVRALADRVGDVLADPATAREMGARLRQRLLAEHSRHAVIPLYQRAYTLALAHAA